MPEIIIGSPNQHMMAVNNSGAIPMAGYYGGTIYPLLVDSAGRLITDATITGSLVIGSVSVNADSVFIQSGANLDLGSAWTTVGSVIVSGVVNTGSTIIDIFRDIDFVLNYTGNDVTSIVQTDGVQTNTLTLVYSGTAVVSGNTVIS